MTIEVYKNGELLGRVPSGQQAVVNIEDGSSEHFRLTGTQIGGSVEVREPSLKKTRYTTAQIKVLKDRAEWTYKAHQVKASDSISSDELYIAETNSK